MSPETPLTQFTTGLDGDDIFVMNRRGDTPDIGDVLYLAAEIDPLLAALRAERDQLQLAVDSVRFELHGLEQARVRDNGYLIAERDQARAERDTLQQKLDMLKDMPPTVAAGLLMALDRQHTALRGEADALRAALRDILPLAEDYLKKAPSHPDNAKLETARALAARSAASVPEHTK